MINQKEQAINSVLEIIRNRIDEFGVSEPTIQKYGAYRIIVELAGVTDSNRARNLIQRTASLEFSLVLNDKWDSVIDKLDTYLLKDTTSYLEENNTNSSSQSSKKNVISDIDIVDVSDIESEDDKLQKDFGSIIDEEKTRTKRPYNRRVAKNKPKSAPATKGANCKVRK